MPPRLGPETNIPAYRMIMSKLRNDSSKDATGREKLSKEARSPLHDQPGTGHSYDTTHQCRTIQQYSPTHNGMIYAEDVIQ